MKCLIPVAIALAACVHAAADTVTLRSGTKVNGTVVRDDREQVIIQDARGKFHTFERADVAKVESNELGKKKPETKPAKADDSDSETGGAKPADRPARAPKEDQEPAAPVLTEVLATGVGKDAEAARKDALRQAVSQVVGSLVVASDAVANDELIDSKILTYSDGYVEKWEPVGEPAAKDGMVRVKIRAWVRQGKLTKALADNNVPVKDIDLRSMQGQSETVAQQAHSAEEVVKALMEGFPARVLSAEALKPVRISGDDVETVIEVPLKVSVDNAKWKAWVDEARRVLDPIAEAKGSEAWNVRGGEWHPLAGARQRGSQQTTNDPENVVNTRANPWLSRLVPADQRAFGAIAGFNVVPTLKDADKRIIAVLDKLGGKLLWWQLPPEAWRALDRLHRRPQCAVSIVSPDGEQLATPIAHWSEAIKSDAVGRESEILFDSGEGGPSWLGVKGNGGACIEFSCLISLSRPSSGGVPSQGFWMVEPKDPATKDADLTSEDIVKVFVPAGVGAATRGFLVQGAILPRRFRVASQIANLAEGAKIEVELKAR